MKLIAVLKDSLRETLDCRTFWVLFAVSSLLILFCWSLSFSPLTPGETLADIAAPFNRLGRGPSAKVHADVLFRVSMARALEAGEYAFELRSEPEAAFHRLVRDWEARTSRLPAPSESPADLDLQKRFLGARLREQGLTRIFINPAEGAPGGLSWSVRLKPARPETLRGAHQASFFFGALKTRLPMSVALFVTILQTTLAQVVAGLVGLLVAVVVTGSFVPDLLQKGRVDLLLAKPVGRAQILAWKYAGGLLYVLASAAYLVGWCWLGIGVRTGDWNPAFLLSILVLAAAFAVLYSFSVFCAVYTRSAIVSILATVALWFVSSGLGDLRGSLRSGMITASVPGWASKALDFLYYLLPKVGDLKAVNNHLIARRNLGEDLASLPGAQNLEALALDWPLILGTSAGFIVVFLALACERFSRKDF
jgi:ABC-type transport system involved in multi-copper enzyme maturation permease subunit